ncbi:MAG: segregation/condensation protein A [Clostridiales Family XIII bacterium]|jgi:segregation and condensation protein A|nr:segregation/condensation protein A [Clostridiales Family XIII bacterium]
MSYKVRLNNFEGPFDLLVYLIEQAEMNIYDIRVSEITAQYLDYIEHMRGRNIPVGADFLVLAATLIELKSRMLLPRIKTDGEVEEDPRTDLTRKLIEYTLFKKRAALLEAQIEAGALRLTKPKEDLSLFTGEPDEYLIMDQEKFIAAFKAFIYRKKKDEELLQIRGGIGRERMSVASKKSAIRKLLKKVKDGYTSFKNLLLPDGGRYDKVVTFVSLLEMARANFVSVRQAGNFTDIEVALSGKPKGEHE